MSELILQLASSTGLDAPSVRKVISTAPRRYKTFSIDKRNGGKREIAQPAREVKLLQRAFHELVLKNLPVHQAATAYQKGSSIKINAARHANSGPILKLDFKDFFPSIRSEDWIYYCRRTGCLQEADISWSCNLLFRRRPGESILRLAIGAPTSPALSNILLNEFDSALSERVARDRVIYTRYADDMTFSAPRAGFLKNVIKDIYFCLRQIEQPKLHINKSKTTFVTTKFRRTVTGLVIANDGRVTIGHKKKRELRAAVHHAVRLKLSASRVAELGGYLSFVNGIEPEFIQKLIQRYGSYEVSRILSSPQLLPKWPTKRSDHFRGQGALNLLVE